MTTIVPGYGPQPARIMLIGERPGYYESRAGIPFVGPSGADLERYLARVSISLEQCRRTNVARDFHEGNPDPTDEEIAVQAPELAADIADTAPEWIIAVGRIAARTLLGYPVSMDSAHGMVLTPTTEAADRWCLGDARIIVAYHPAAAMHNQSLGPIVYSDYQRAGGYIHGDIEPLTPTDDYVGREDYRELDDDEYDTITTLCDPGEHKHGGVACDTEGYRTDPWMIQLSIQPGTGYIIRHNQHGLIKHLDSELARLNPLVIFHSSLHDLEVLRVMGVRAPRRIADTMTMAYLLQTEPLGLKPLARRYAAMEMQEYSEVVAPAQARLAKLYLIKARDTCETIPEWTESPEKVVIKDGKAKVSRRAWSIEKHLLRILKDANKPDKTKDVDYYKRWLAIDESKRDQVSEVLGPIPRATLLHVEPDIAIRYAARDPDATIRIYMPLLARLRAMDLLLVMKLDMGTVPMFARMQSAGMEIVPEILERIADKCTIEMTTAAAVVGCNPNSNLQLAPILLDDLRVRRPDKVTKKTKQPKIDDPYLEGLKADLESRHQQNTRAYEVIDATLHYRECSKLRGTYTHSLIKLADEHNRLRTNWRITTVVTGRPSTDEPNLLNIPVRTKFGRKVRSAFVAREGCVLCTADYSGIEMRLMAHISEDENMIEVFTSGKDIHDQTASRMFDIPVDQLHPMQHRYPAKTVGFRVIYGGGGPGLQRGLKAVKIDWSLDKCQQLIDDYTQVIYPGVGRYMKARVSEAKRNGLVRESMSGRIRYLPDATSDNRWQQYAAFREGINFPIQSGAATIMKEGMISCWRRLPELWNRGIYAEPLVQQYDELIFEVEEDHVDTLKEIIVDSMVNAVKLSVRMKVSWATGYSWAELEK